MKRGLLDLPVLPDVTHRVRRLVEDDQTNVAQVAMFLSLDPALSARLLHVANSVSQNSTDKTFIVSCR